MEVGRLGVALHVEGQMVRAAEATVAVAALEGLRPGVLPVVAGQFVGSREPPLATFPRTLVRLFTWNETKQTIYSNILHQKNLLFDKIITNLGIGWKFDFRKVKKMKAILEK